MVNDFLCDKHQLSRKQAKFILARFLMENNVLKEFIKCYKHQHPSAREYTSNEVLLSSIGASKHCFFDLFNYRDTSFAWYEVAKISDVNWDRIHHNWQSIISREIKIIL